MSVSKTKLALVAAATMLFSVASQAAVIKLTAVNAVWQNVTPVSVTNTNIQYQTVGNSVQVRWGAASQPISSRSGYGFAAAALPVADLSLGNPFLLGNFTHFNLPITAGTSITGAELRVSFQITVDGIAINDMVLASFIHTETPNSCTPLPTCANDLVSLQTTSSTTQFVHNNVEYTLDVLGFSTNNGGNIVEDFSTVENRNNTASLYAKLVGQPLNVPEPETMGLLGMALVALSLAKRAKA